MATKTYHNNYPTNNDKIKTSFVYCQTQIPHFVGNNQKNRRNINNTKNYDSCSSKVTKENLNMQSSTKENRHHHDNYILHRYLNSKYQQEKGKVISGTKITNNPFNSYMR